MPPTCPRPASFTAAYATADWLASPDWVLKKAHVAHVDELHAKPLEDCDRLAAQVGFGSQAIALVDGVVTGAGGFVLAAADVGALTIVALRAICRVGQCYGYALDQGFAERSAETRACLGAEAYAKEWDTGRHMTLDDLRAIPDPSLSASPAPAVSSAAAGPTAPGARRDLRGGVRWPAQHRPRPDHPFRCARQGREPD